MQAPAAAKDLFQLIEKSGLLSASQVQKIREKLQLDSAAAAAETARILVKARVLTPFQAERLLEGRYRGLVIDQYKIRELLGFGGMGCVFIAEDPEHDRKVAIKVLSSEHALDAGMLARMKLEAAAGMRLKHPNIIRTLRIDSTGAVHYLVMDLVRGISLHELVALRGPVPWASVCDIGLQAADALHYAHQHGIIHRDIKPANFLLEQSGVAHILDFGLALISGDKEEEFTLAMVFGHECLGTPDYIAPEQITDSRHVDSRADIYSLGATLYVALTAHVPFPDKSNKAKLEAHKKKTPRSVREFRPEIPAEVAAIIAKMMAKDPAQRFSSMQAVAQALQPFAKRAEIPFDFRELVTIRSQQAKARANQKDRKPATPRSSITSASGWLRSSGHDFSAPTDSFGRSETPDVSSTGQQQVRNAPRPSSVSNAQSLSTPAGAVPVGWRFEVQGRKLNIPLARTLQSIGSGLDADIRIKEDGMDKIQCWIEFDGLNWQLRQESKSFPTYVNGAVEAYCSLHHGSRLSFGGKVSLKLINLSQRQRSHRRRLIFGVTAASTAIISACAWFVLRWLKIV